MKNKYKKKKIKRKIKWKSLFKIIIVFIIMSLIYLIIKVIPTNHIVVKGNSYVSDEEVINSSLYKTDIENQYLLYNKCIPVKQNNKWCLFDITGRKLTELIYDDFGCSVGAKVSGEQNANNVLLIPKYECIVVKSGNLYGVIDSSGQELIQSILNSVYYITESGETTYHMTANAQDWDVIQYIEQYVKKD